METRRPSACSSSVDASKSFSESAEVADSRKDWNSAERWFWEEEEEDFG